MKIVEIEHVLGVLRGHHSYFAEGEAVNFKPPGFNRRLWEVLLATTKALVPFADPANWSEDEWGLVQFTGPEEALLAARAAMEMR